MSTVVLTIDCMHPQREVVARAAAVVRDGGTVAFPTETVYGLGADATSVAAVQKIFAAKGRPAGNPLIVHVTDAAAARRYVAAWPPAAERLARRWWPGPLTLVLPKSAAIPDVVTGGGPTVALRAPAHPVARALIAAAERPLAAPSANRSTRVSSTTAEHVRQALDGRIDMLLDGGPTPGGLESTVVDLSRPDGVRLLRPGPVDVRDLEAELGCRLERGAAVAADGALPSPGLMKKHYAPAVPTYLTTDDGASRVAQLLATGHTVGWIPLGEPSVVTPTPRVRCVPLPAEPTAYAARLYATLHELEAGGVMSIVVERPPPSPDWAAVCDRLQRAAAE